MATERKPFPYDPEEFANDERISYSKPNKTYLLEDETGVEWEWLAGIKKWTKTISEEEMRQQAEAYKVAGVDEDEPAFNPSKKRKEAAIEDAEKNPKAAKTAATTGDEQDTANGAHAIDAAANDAAATGATAAATEATAAASSAPAAKQMPPAPTKAIYVTGLPLDTDKGELREFFKKFGIIAESVDTDERRIKMYADADGNFKGEALIIFHSYLSVNQALLYDGEPLRIGDTLKMTIEPADISYKSKGDKTFNDGGDSAPSHKISKAKAKAKAEEMNSRLADWDSDDDDRAPQIDDSLKVVIVKKAFSINELDEDQSLLKEIPDDMKEVGEKFGVVKNVTLFDKEQAGVVTIRFSNAVAAKKCADDLQGKYYGGRNLIALLDDGSKKFRKTVKTEAQKEAEEKERLEEYAKHIEAEE